MSPPLRSIPPSLRDTKRNPLGICVRPVDDNQFEYFYWNEGSLAVMAVTLPCDEGYSSPFRLSAYFDLSGSPRCKKTRAIVWKFGRMPRPAGALNPAGEGLTSWGI